MSSTESCENGLNIKVARLEERLVAADKALELARQALSAYQVANNEWRQENIDQRNMYMTTDKAEALLSTEAALRQALESRVYALEKGNQADVGKRSAYENVWLKAITIVGLILAGVTLIIKLVP